MLQAAVSIRAGADVVAALQSVIEQLSQERVIELRRYGQRLNAIAMFYMLFGIILPSMGIAVITILTTFIAIFTVNTTILEFAIVGIVFLADRLPCNDNKFKTGLFACDDMAEIKFERLGFKECGTCALKGARPCRSKDGSGKAAQDNDNRRGSASCCRSHS